MSSTQTKKTKKTGIQQNISDIKSEDLGLRLATLFEQAFALQQNIHAITAELKKRQQAIKDNNDAPN